ncbi:MAG: hypothetical protein HY081_00650 [Gammaproteobacteria bacterium]|nr:hypothetical protein [Gammaproteobacteria bacterium]
MITVLVSVIIILVLALVGVWFFSSAFRIWTEQPKYTLLERDKIFEHAMHALNKGNRDNAGHVPPT